MNASSQLFKNSESTYLPARPSSTRAAGLPTAERPPEGFATSPAWADPSSSAIDAYQTVLSELIWPHAPASSIEDCCRRVTDLANLL